MNFVFSCHAVLRGVGRRCLFFCVDEREVLKSKCSSIYCGVGILQTVNHNILFPKIEGATPLACFLDLLVQEPKVRLL
jgi:hypothetical protein